MCSITRVFPLIHTCIFGPFKDGGDLIALRGVTLAPHSRCTHTHCALISLHSTQVCCGCASAVCYLSIRVVCLRKRRWKLGCLGLDPDGIIVNTDKSYGYRWIKYKKSIIFSINIFQIRSPYFVMCMVKIAVHLQYLFYSKLVLQFYKKSVCAFT